MPMRACAIPCFNLYATVIEGRPAIVVRRVASAKNACCKKDTSLGAQAWLSQIQGMYGPSECNRSAVLSFLALAAELHNCR